MNNVDGTIMFCGLIEIPDEILEAQENGTLVIFAGAGISKDKPSNLPDFNELVEQIGSGSKSVFNAKNDLPDQYLGKIKNEGVDVHGLAKQIITVGSQPLNDYHNLIPRLFTKSDKVRIITTNQDILLLEGVRSKWNSVRSYEAPALPDGDDFDGLVFLHGSVCNPRQMILTDEDFSRAYLTKGWARRFLVQLFGKYTVLFIGYSHEDVVMSYLARGLPTGEKRRFAFYNTETKKDESMRWLHLGIEPIKYSHQESDGGPHKKLIEGLKEWAKDTAMGLLEHRSRVIELAKAYPPINNQDADYLKRRLADPALLKAFTDNAKKSEWIEWIDNRGFFKSLLTIDSIKDEQQAGIAYVLATWLADMGVGEGHIEALHIVQRGGAVWNRILWFAVAHSLHYHQDIPHARFNHWVCALLAAPIPLSGKTHYLGYALAKCQAVERETTALLLFDKMTHPNPMLTKPFSIHSDPLHIRWDIVFSEDDYYLREEWGKLFSPNLNRFADHILTIAETNLRLAYNIVQAENNFNLLDHLRNSIADNDEDNFIRHDSAVDILIEAIRDCLQWIMTNRPDEGVVIAKRYLRSNRDIFQRLALYAMANSQTPLPDDFISWVLDVDLITPDTESSELSLLLERTYPNASLETRIAVLNRIEEHYQESAENDDDAVRAVWMRQKILRHLATAAPTCVETARRWIKAKAGIPESELPTGIPGKRSGVTTGWVVPISPFSKEEILDADPITILEKYDSLENEDIWNRAPDKSGLKSQIREVTAENSGFGIRLAKTLTNRQDPNHPLWRAILQGWSNAPISGDEWEQVLTCIENNDAVIEINHDPTANLLESAVKNETRRPSFSLLARLEHLANILWNKIESIEDRRIIGENVNWNFLAINSTAGRLTTFWLHALSWRRKESGSDWKGLPDEYRNRFNHILDSATYGAMMGQNILTSHAKFLYYLDIKWVSERLASLFDYKIDESRAERAWNGFVYEHFSQPLVKILQPHLQPLFGKLSKFSDDVRRGLICRISFVVYHDGSKWMKDGLLAQFIVAIDEQDCVEFTRAFGDFWYSGKEDWLKESWDGWINEYIQARKSGKPTQFSAQEIGALADWVFPFAFMVDRFVETVVALPTPNIGYTHIFHRLKESDLPEKAPKATLDFFGWLLNGAKVGNFWEGDDVLDIVERLVKSGIKLIDLRNAIGEKCVELNLRRILELLDNQ